MKTVLAVLLSGFLMIAGAASPAEPQTMRPQVASVQPGDEAIRKAVREVLDEHPEEWRHPARTISSDKYQQFADQFNEAKVPDCLHPDALKRQPPAIGPIAFNYLLAVPFVVLAKARGKCN